MKSLIDHPTTTLRWLRSGFVPPDFELVGNEGVFATLAFLNEERTMARIRTADGSWTLKHLGILTPVVTLREERSTTNVATFHPHALRHGSLQFHDGTAFDWAWLHEGEGGGVFLDHGGKPVLHLQAHSGRDLRSIRDFERCDVKLNPVLPSYSMSALLAGIGWYLMLFDHLKERNDSAAETALRL